MMMMCVMVFVIVMVIVISIDRGNVVTDGNTNADGDDV